MNGLEAIRLMEQGKMVTSEYEATTYIFKIIDGNVCSKRIDEPRFLYQTDSAFNFSCDYQEYTSPKPLTGWGRTEHLECAAGFYVITECDVLAERISYNHVLNKKCYENANYFSKKEKAEEINFKQTLFRKLQRFSDENGGNEIDWNDGYQCKYFISYNHHYRELEVDCRRHRQDFGKVYFVSKKNAKKTIELFRDDLIKYFTM